MFDDEREDSQQDETPEAEAPEESVPAAEEPTAPAEEPAAPAEEAAAPAEEAEAEAPTAEEPDVPAAEEPETPSAEEPEAPAAEEPEAPATEEPEVPATEEPEVPAAEEPEAPAGEKPKPRPKRGSKKEEAKEPELIPGAHLEPDLVLEEAAAADRAGVGQLAGAEIQAAEEALAAEGEPGAERDSADQAPIASAVLDLAADARYRATGKRKSAIARVTLKPGTGAYTINGRELDQFFPRATLQRMARGPLETAGHHERMDVVAKIQGGGVSSQAGALRHGIARALVEADPNLRGELKRRGFLTRDPRVKERKKAGLKKARKRPQFSKR